MKFFAAFVSTLTLLGAAVQASVLPPRSFELDICAYISAELIIEVDGIPKIFGVLDVCLCLSIVPDFIKSNKATKKALEVVDELVVLAAIGALMDGATPCAPSPSQMKKRDTYVLTDDICPRGLSLCGVSSSYSKTAWECLDIQTDLESCGGCSVGLLDNAPTGVDCSSIEGVEDVACRAGKCAVSSCSHGYKVSECGTMCVPDTTSVPSKHRLTLDTKERTH